MSNNLARHASQRQAVVATVKEVDSIKSELKNMAMSINQVIMMMRQQLMDTAEMTAAIAKMLGEDEVNKVIKEERIKRLTENLEVEKAQIAQAVADGKLVVAEVVTPKSLIVGCEFEADGSKRPPGQAHVQFNSLDKKFQELLLGKPKGFILEPTPAGGKFEVFQIYEEVPPKPQAAATPVAAESTDEASSIDDGTPSPETPAPAPAEVATAAPADSVSGFSFEDDSGDSSSN